MKISPIQKPLPKCPPLRKLIGPSFIILGVGLGSGELILWPYLASNYGLGLVWACVLGISFQFIINMEIERYTLATGESIFSGLTNKFGKLVPYWFMFSTFVPWMWPGIIASAAKLVSAALQIEYSPLTAIVLLLALGGLFSLGQVVYKTQELVQKLIILLGVPFIFLMTAMFTKASHVQSLLQGLIGQGDGFVFLPKDIPLATFLTALAYAGAGGNLNLAQSLYIREKGYAMGAYSAKITNIFSRKKEENTHEGDYFKFDLNENNLKEFQLWWKRINIEHAMVFWATGAFTMLLLSLLAYSTVYKDPNVSTSINFIIEESRVIGERLGGLVSTVFLLAASLMLFGTQFSVFGSNSRILTENLRITKRDINAVKKTPKYFFGFLWLQIATSILIFASGFKEPLTLLVIGGVLNALSMAIYTGLTLWLNQTTLPKQLRPTPVRLLAIVSAFLFYAGFTSFTIINLL